MNAIEKGVALNESWATRNGKLTGIMQLWANLVMGIEGYCRKNKSAYRKHIAYRLARALGEMYGFDVRWEKT